MYNLRADYLVRIVCVKYTANFLIYMMALATYLELKFDHATFNLVDKVFVGKRRASFALQVPPILKKASEVRK